MEKGATVYLDPVVFDGSYKVITNVLVNKSYSFINRAAHITLYFKELKYTEVSEMPKMTTANVISNIGGTFGLFLGLSLMSFFEILQLFLKCFIYLKKQQKVVFFNCRNK